MRELLRETREFDEEDNRRTTPGEDDSIHLRCVWAVELYAPPHAARLAQSFEDLGWTTEDPGIAGSTPTSHLKSLRGAPFGGGWYNLGPLREPGATSWWGTRNVPLPRDVDHAMATMYGLSASVTAIVVGFVLNEQATGRYEQILRRDRRHQAAPPDSKHLRLLSSGNQKSAEIWKHRDEWRKRAAYWFREHLPGVFTEGTDGDALPTCELVTFTGTEPFVDARPTPDWLMLLNMQADSDAWASKSYPGLRFAWPLLGYEGSRFHAAATLHEDNLSEGDLRNYSGNLQHALTSSTNGHLTGLLSRWATLALITTYEERLQVLRDARLPSSAEEMAHRSLPGLYGDLSVCLDVATTVADLEQIAADDGTFESEVGRFEPVVSELYSADTTLAEALRTSVFRRSVRLTQLERLLRDLLLQHGTVRGTIENVHLQGKVGRLTLILVGLTVALVVLTLGLVPLDGSVLEWMLGLLGLNF